MTDAELYRRTHALLRAAKLQRWTVSRTAADGFWRLTSPSGAAVVIAARPDVRALLAAEVQFARIERQHPTTSGTRVPEQPRTEP